MAARGFANCWSNDFPCIAPLGKTTERVGILLVWSGRHKSARALWYKCWPIRANYSTWDTRLVCNSDQCIEENWPSGLLLIWNPCQVAVIARTSSQWCLNTAELHRHEIHTGARCISSRYIDSSSMGLTGLYLSPRGTKSLWFLSVPGPGNCKTVNYVPAIHKPVVIAWTAMPKEIK